jgi:hypothetical protein
MATKKVERTALDKLLGQIARIRADRGRTPRYLATSSLLFEDLQDEILFLPGHRDKGAWIELRLGDEVVEVFPKQGKIS